MVVLGISVREGREEGGSLVTTCRAQLSGERQAVGRPWYSFPSPKSHHTLQDEKQRFFLFMNTRPIGTSSRPIPNPVSIVEEEDHANQTRKHGGIKRGQ